MITLSIPNKIKERMLTMKKGDDEYPSACYNTEKDVIVLISRTVGCDNDDDFIRTINHEVMHQVLFKNFGIKETMAYDSDICFKMELLI